MQILYFFKYSGVTIERLNNCDGCIELETTDEKAGQFKVAIKCSISINQSQQINKSLAVEEHCMS
jgi:hypothetical protein